MGGGGGSGGGGEEIVIGAGMEQRTWDTSSLGDLKSMESSLFAPWSYQSLWLYRCLVSVLSVF